MCKKEKKGVNVKTWLSSYEKRREGNDDMFPINKKTKKQKIKIFNS